MDAELRLIREEAEFERLEPVWNDLLSRSPSNNYFLRWEWLWHWWGVYSRRGDKLTIFIWQTDEGVACIAPFYIRERRLGGVFTVRRMMFLGTQEESEGDVCSDYMDIIYRDGEGGSAIRSLFDFMNENDICDEIYISRIDMSSGTFPIFQHEAERLGFMILTDNEFASPFITLPQSWDHYLKGLSSSKRWNIKNERRKLQSKNGIHFRSSGNPADLGMDFQTFVDLHQKQWMTKGMTGAFTNEKFIRFHQNIMHCMLERGNLNLVLLCDGDQCKAADYNILYKNKVYFYQTGRDIDNEKIAYGNIIRYYCIEQAINDGLSEYDFLPEGRFDDYKEHFTKEHRTVCDLYMVRNRTTKQFLRTKEFARSMYHRIKPFMKQDAQ